MALSKAKDMDCVDSFCRWSQEVITLLVLSFVSLSIGHWQFTDGDTANALSWKTATNPAVSSQERTFLTPNPPHAEAEETDKALQPMEKAFAPQS